jgi:uncharacterized protein with WD repeat
MKKPLRFVKDIWGVMSKFWEVTKMDMKETVCQRVDWTEDEEFYLLECDAV